MNSLITQKFILLLGGIDAGWHERSVEMAAEVLADFSDDDWVYLAEYIKASQKHLQERCAEAVGESEIRCGIPVLLSLVNSKSVQVSAIAASQLDDLNAIVPIEYKARLEEVLKYLDSQKSSRKEDVQRLLNQMNTD